MTNRSFKMECRKQNRLEVLGIQKPNCTFCEQTYWQCLTSYYVDDPDNEDGFVIECMKCQKVRSGKIRRQKPSKRNSVGYHACTCCGDDECYLENNHLYCFDGKEICVPKCANCHAIVTDAQIDHGKFPREAKNAKEANRLFILNVKETVKLMALFRPPQSIIDEFICMVEEEAPCLGLSVHAILVPILRMRS